MGTPVAVVIPVKDHLELTLSIVDQLHRQGGFTSLFVLDNGSTDGTAEWLADQAAAGRLDATDACGLTLHQMWNAGIALARVRHPAPNVAILNNDLVLGPDFCGSLADALDRHPDLWAVSPNYDARPVDDVDLVTSTYKNQGLAGFAFMVRGEALDHLAFDEELRWWYGDDDLVAQIEACGHRVGISGATWVEHIGGGSQTIGYTLDTISLIEHDLLHMLGKWGHP